MSTENHAKLLRSMMTGYADLLSLVAGFKQIAPDTAHMHADRIVNCAMALDASSLGAEEISAVSQLTGLVSEVNRVAFNAKFM